MPGPVAIVALALALRLGFVLWAPGIIGGDARFYHGTATMLAFRGTYTWADGSPAVQWMPGWPIILAGLYVVFGEQPRAGMIAAAVFGAATAGLLVVLGSLLFDRRTGRLAGLLYAVWPGNIYYTATLFTEPAFNFFLALGLTLFAAGARADARREAWYFAAGLALGLSAMVKSEPLLLLPVMLLFVWTARRSATWFWREAAVVVLGTALVIAPWTYRNYVVFGRFMVTSAAGGFIAAVGARAAPPLDFLVAGEIARKHKGSSYADMLFKANAEGWSEVWSFVRTQPRTWLGIQGEKLAATYGSDADGAVIMRGLETGTVYLAAPTFEALVRVANWFWWTVVSLAVLGLLTVRSWWPPARVLLLGVNVLWLVLHVLMVAGPRFHVPETLAMALVAARALRVVLPGSA